jgi:hypothetical protein
VTGKWAVRKLGAFLDDKDFFVTQAPHPVPLFVFFNAGKKLFTYFSRFIFGLSVFILSMPQIKYESLFVLYSF